MLPVNVRGKYKKGMINMIKDEVRSKEISNDTYLLETKDGGSTSYLLKGGENAIIIDPGYGLINVRSYAENLIGVPVKYAANTHGHFDHAGGNVFFEKVYMRKEAEIDAKTPYPSLVNEVYDFNYRIEYVADGSLINLGGRTLEVLEVPSHSMGDIVFIDTKTRTLFIGDFAGKFVSLMYKMNDPQPTVENFVRNVRKIIERKNDFDSIATGHGEELMSADLIQKCLENALNIMDGNLGDPFNLPDKPRPQNDWKWRGPRPGDFEVFLPEYKRCSNFADVMIEYDIRYIHEKHE
jgi:glyoxylase-like metal-dependent hydrolase (beta-lactamase superfamily II)